MAAISSITMSGQVGAVAAAVTTLSADDTITFDQTKKQLLVLRNTTGGSLTVTIDGDAGTTVALDGVGSVSVSGGLAIAVPAGESRAVVLGTVRHYCQGVVHLLGASGLTAQLFNL